MQALHGHLGAEGEEGGDEEAAEVKQIWQEDFSEGGLTKVQLLQAQEDIGIERRR